MQLKLQKLPLSCTAAYEMQLKLQKSPLSCTMVHEMQLKHQKSPLRCTVAHEVQVPSKIKALTCTRNHQMQLPPKIQPPTCTPTTPANKKSPIPDYALLRTRDRGSNSKLQTPNSKHPKPISNNITLKNKDISNTQHGGDTDV